MSEVYYILNQFRKGFFHFLIITLITIVLGLLTPLNLPWTLLAASFVVFCYSMTILYRQNVSIQGAISMYMAYSILPVLIIVGFLGAFFAGYTGFGYAVSGVFCWFIAMSIDIEKGERLDL